MKFRRYQHLEKFGTQATDGITTGTAYVFPKLDGTNASTWLDVEVEAGSRSRKLSVENDNQGFCVHVRACAKLAKFHFENPDLRLYGEWLVPHSLNTYRDDAWRDFYVFDVVREHGDGCDDENFEYLPYDEYKELLDKYEINYIPPIAIIKNATEESIYKCLEKNGFLIKDGEGTGEGIVLKNYGFINRYGRVVWAKVVTNEFKEKMHKIMGAPEVTANKIIEDKILEDFVTSSLIDKEHAKIVNEMDGWSSKYIPRLLNTVYYSVVTEEMWNIVKAYKNPVVDFKRLQRLITAKIKTTKPELFVRD
jgi:hypothetical protein